MSATRARRFDLIAFDWDGTLFDSTAIIVRCIQDAVRDVGGQVPSDRDAAWVIGMGLMEALAHAAPHVPREKHAELRSRYGYHYARHQNDLSLFEGCCQCWKTCAQPATCWPWPPERAAGARRSPALGLAAGHVRWIPDGR